MNKLALKAPAKINLALQVLEKREDGYHNINSIMTRVPIYDEIVFEAADCLSLECNVDLGIAPEQNLVYKAARLFLDEFKITAGVKISLSKTIPAGGGLGGGSSDCATTLLGLAEFFGIKNADDAMYKIACSLGSDIPFFLREGTAIATSRGELLEYFDFTLPWEVLLVAPGFSVNTGKAYSELDKRKFCFDPAKYADILPRIAAFPRLMPLMFRNDFMYPEMPNCSEICFIVKKLYASGALFASMSGSGSTCFGLFADHAKLESSLRYFGNYRTLHGKF